MIWTPEAVRALRGSLTQEEFAHKLGVSFASVNRWENNINKCGHVLNEKPRMALNLYALKKGV